MRIDIEQFLALTVAIGAIGAVGVGVYTAQADAPSLTSEVEVMETFGDDFELKLERKADEPTEVASADPPLLAKPPAPDYADDINTGGGSIAGPSVE